MHVFRWLLSRPIITVWILAALVILLNIRMGGGDSHEAVEHGEAKAAHVKGAQQAPESHAEAVKPPPSAKEVVAPVLAKESSAVISESLADDEVAIALSVESAKAAPQAQKNDALVKTEKAVVNDSESNVATPLVSSANVEAQKESGKVATEEKSNDSSTGLDSMNQDDLLKLAREAFWQNEKDKSAAIYQELIQRDPSSLAFKGELANVLWHQNKQKESAKLYAEIAMPMLEQGKSREVGNMLGFIGVFFPEKAREIHRSMSE